MISQDSMEKTVPGKKIFIGLSVLAIVVSIIHSYLLRWLGDDVFIGFRYVENFLKGNGLVYNVGEHVEGYTHFLWILLISFFSKMGCSPEVTVQVLGILSSIGTLVIFSVIGYKISNHLKGFSVPFIVLALALNYDYNVWATSGLETAMYGFFFSAAFYIYFFSAIKEGKKLLFTGLILCLALLTRPDAMVIVLGANMLLVVRFVINREGFMTGIKKLVLFNLPFVIIYLPYFMWRYNYYGFIFPNTYYDKLGYETWFSAGFYYIKLYMKSHFTSLLIAVLPPFVLIPLIIKNKINLDKWKEFLSDRVNAAFISSLAFVYLYLIGFIAKVGGDFMYARFIIPTAPFIYLIIYYSISKLFNGKLAVVLCSIILLLSLVETKRRMEIFKPVLDKEGVEHFRLKRGIADERWFYIHTSPYYDQQEIGTAIKECFKGIPARQLIRGAQACLGYYCDFDYCMEYHGLADTVIAHSSISTRGRIGHEKHATLEYIESRGIDFLFNVKPQHERMTEEDFRDALIIITPDTIKTELLTYRTEIISQLKTRLGNNFRFVDFTAYLDDYIKNKMPAMSFEQLKSDYEKFRLYYFMHNNDKERENVFLTTIFGNK